MQGIVIQGPTNFYKELSDYYCQFDNVVWSTWDNEPKENIDYIKSKGIEVIFNGLPSFNGYMNVNFQVLSTYKGIEFLKNKNIKEVLKVRSDTIVTNLDKLLPKLKGKELSFMALAKEGVRKDCYYELEYLHYSHDYPADNVIYGTTENLSTMFNFQVDEMLSIPPEALITWNYLVSKDIDFNLNYNHLIDNGISFFLQDCLDENVEVNWLKRKVNLVDWYKDKTVYEW
jgi:hypothetical protein